MKGVDWVHNVQNAVRSGLGYVKRPKHTIDENSLVEYAKALHAKELVSVEEVAFASAA